MGMNEPWVCFVQCWRGKVSHPDLYFSLVVTDNSSTTREKSLFWGASFMLHGTWESTNFLSVFDNTLKIMLCCLGSFWKQGPNVSLEEISCVLHLCLVDLTVCMELVVVAVHREHHSQSSFSLVKWWKGRAGREFTNSSTEQNQTSLTAQTLCLYDAVPSHSLCSIHMYDSWNFHSFCF